MKKLKFVCILMICGMMLSSFLFSNNYKEASARDKGEETYRTFLLSSNLNSQSAKISFDNFTSSLDMELISSSNSLSLFYAYVPSSKISTYVYFKDDNNNSFYTKVDTQTNFYNFNGSSSGSSSISSLAKICTKIPSSYQTRRIWFTLSNEENGFLGIYDGSGIRYMLTRIYNNIDERYYHYVDVPTSLSTYTLQLIVDHQCSAKTNLVNSKAYSNSELHRINYVDVNSNTISEYTPTGLDQYFINDYLKGFSSCLKSDINGYLAYSPYICNITSKFTSYQDGTLLDVFQDDYMPSDFVDDYSSQSIRGGYIVSAYEKLSLIAANYNERNNNKLFLVNNSNNNFTFCLFVGLCSLLGISSFVLYRCKNK